MNLDIQTGILTAALLAALGVLLAFLAGINAIRAGNRLMYFRKRRDLVVRGWRLIFLAVVLLVLAFSIFRFGEPVAYRFFPPSPTPTLTPTITQTATITLTPTISLTPTITNTPSVTDTPSMPIALEAQFLSTITPNPTVIFSTLVFGTELDENFQPVDPAEEFANPVKKMYAVFSYDQMTIGAQWSALWYRGQELVCFETLPWNGGTGGFGYTECTVPTGGWLPAEYEVQLFIGTLWKQSGRFIISGNPPTATPSITPSRTLAPTATIAPTATRPSATPVPTLTPSNTPTVTRTPTSTNTRRPTDTRRPTLTAQP
jgi:hypothetical protein